MAGGERQLAHQRERRIADGDLSGRASWATESRSSGYPMFLGLTPSAYGGSLLVVQAYSGGQYGEDEWQIRLIDGAAELAYSELSPRVRSKTWPLGIVSDPLRDLVIEERVLDGS